MISGAMVLNRLISSTKQGRLSSLNFDIVNYIEKLTLEFKIIQYFSVRRRSDIDLFTPFKFLLFYLLIKLKFYLLIFCKSFSRKTRKTPSNQTSQVSKYPFFSLSASKIQIVALI